MRYELGAKWKVGDRIYYKVSSSRRVPVRVEMVQFSILRGSIRCDYHLKSLKKNRILL